MTQDLIPPLSFLQSPDCICKHNDEPTATIISALNISLGHHSFPGHPIHQTAKSEASTQHLCGIQPRRQENAHLVASTFHFGSKSTFPRHAVFKIKI